MIIWITGISGSGKTTVATELKRKLKQRKVNVITVDGDIIREIFGRNLNYDIESRVIQIKRIQKLSLFLQNQGLVVIVAALYSNRELLYWNRKYFKIYYEIYLKASIHLVRKRDVKNLYKKYDEGLEKNIVGIDIPWHEPESFDLRIDMDQSPTLEEVIREILQKIKTKERI